VTTPETKHPRFGKFEVLQLLGRGGMAEVYKARIVEGPRTGQLVALKRLSPKLSQDSEALDLFTGEADISRLLKHPNIVQIFETGVVGDLYYLAMEYVDGRDLAQVLSRCRERKILLPVTFAVHIARAMLDALGYAHRAVGPSGQPLNVIHCDVSPSNLFISRTGDIKLGDFGIAKAHAFEGADFDPGGTLWGKVAYLAPEVLERSPLTPQADLWSAAAVLYECLAGQRAIQGPNTDALKESLRAVRITPVEALRPGLPEGLAAVIRKAFSKLPKDRFANAAAFRDSLAPYDDEAIGGALGIASMVRGLFGA
jgi:serine/threonine protein kinase